MHAKFPLLHPSGHHDASSSSAARANDRVYDASRSSLDSLVATPSDSPTIHDPYASPDAALGPQCGSSPSVEAVRDTNAHLLECMGPASAELQGVPLVAEVLAAGARQNVTHLQFAQQLAQLSARLTACITHLIPGAASLAQTSHVFDFLQGSYASMCKQHLFSSDCDQQA